MDLSQLIPLVASLASAVAAILAWIAKIQWADEYSKAKDETIKAKDTLIEVKDAQLQTLISNKDEIIKAKEEQIKVLEKEVKSLNELTPMKIREYFLSVREQMEEYNNLLKKELDEAHQELRTKSEEIQNLKQEGEKNINEIEKLEQERENIAAAAATLESQLSELQQKFDDQKEILVRMPKIDAHTYEVINNSFKTLTEAMSKNYSKDLARMSKIILESSKFAQREQEIMKQLLTYRNIYAHGAPARFLPGEPKEPNLLKDTNEANDDRDLEDSDQNEVDDDADPIAA